MFGPFCCLALFLLNVPHSLWALSGNLYLHDPSIVKLQNGANPKYVIYSSHNGMEEHQSADRNAWQLNSAAFPGGIEAIVKYSGNKMEFWAPDISYQGGKYFLYYSVSKFGSKVSAIGMSQSKSGLPGTFTDNGIVIESSASTSYNAIDPNLFVDSNGKWWLQFGSFFSGIQQVELDPASGKRKAGAVVKQIATRPDNAANAIEAPFLFKKGSFYYLFVSFDNCCKGVASTYRIMVGRASAPTGPFVDKTGKSMTQGGGTLVLGTSGTQIGPGGQSVLADADGDQLVYHYYDKAENGAAKLGIRALKWSSNGWPSV